MPHIQIETHSRRRRSKFQFRLSTLLIFAAAVCLVAPFLPTLWRWMIESELLVFIPFWICVIPCMWLCWREIVGALLPRQPRASERLGKARRTLDDNDVDSEPATARRPRKRRKKKTRAWFQPPGIGPSGYR